MHSATATVNPAAPHRAVAFARTITTFPVLISVAMVVGIFGICRNRITDPDIWWHLRNAQYLVTNLHFPNIDTYSYTTAGAPWLNHEWLSELFYYAAFRALGLTGIFLVFAGAISALLVAVFWLALKESDDPFASIIVTGAGALLASVGFGPRTQHFGWLCFVVMYAILLRFRSARQAPLWLLPPLFAVWINFHGSWVVGLVVYGIFVVAGLVPRDIGHLAADPWSKSDLKKLILTAAASVAALFANPFGYRLVLYPFEFMLRLKVAVGHVDEWFSVDFNEPRGKVVAIVLGGIFAMALIRRKRWRIDDALLTAFVLYSALTHMRFLLLAGIVLPPILAPQLGHISSWDRGDERRSLNSALLAAALGIFVLLFPAEAKLQSRMPEYFPARALQFLRAHPQSGHLFNAYHWGGYLEWNLPEVPTFVDTRSDIFEYRGIFRDYVDVIQLHNSQEILDRHQVSYILWPADEPLAYYLASVPEWACIYNDGQAAIFQRSAVEDPR